MKRQKIKIHFNRVNMQRKDSRVWSAHTSTACNMSERIVVMHNGTKVLETVFNPDARQPRAYMLTQGTVTVEDGITVITL